MQSWSTTDAGLNAALHTSIVSCILGPFGRYSESNGRITVCDKCPAGRFLNSSGNTASSDCTECPLGYYAPTTETFLCSACAIGKYLDEVGRDADTYCKNCPEGRYGDELGIRSAEEESELAPLSDNCKSYQVLRRSLQRFVVFQELALSSDVQLR